MCDISKHAYITALHLFHTCYASLLFLCQNIFCLLSHYARKHKSINSKVKLLCANTKEQHYNAMLTSLVRWQVGHSSFSGLNIGTIKSTWVTEWQWVSVLHRKMLPNIWNGGTIISIGEEDVMNIITCSPLHFQDWLPFPVRWVISQQNRACWNLVLEILETCQLNLRQPLFQNGAHQTSI